MSEEIVDAMDESDDLVMRAEAYISRRRGMLPGTGVAMPYLAELLADIEAEVTSEEILPSQTQLEELLPPPVSPLIHTLQPALPTLEVPSVAPAYETPSEDMVLGIDSATLKTLVNEVSRNISRHLMSELPELLYTATLSTLEADLRRGIAAATEVAARNFIAQRVRLEKHQK